MKSGRSDEDNGMAGACEIDARMVRYAKKERRNMDFCWCTLHVEDLEGSLKFYSEIIGLPVERRISTPETEIVFLGNGETKIELIRDRDNRILNRPDGISLGFKVLSLDDTVKTLHEKDIPIDSGPFQPNPHIRFLFVRDPNGLKIQFVENT